MLNVNVSGFRQLEKDTEVLKRQIMSRLDEVIMPYYFQKLQSITFRAHQIGQETIKAATTPTGAARAAAGGNGPGRVDSGEFLAGFTLDSGRKFGKIYEFNIGWLNGTPRWASYQEMGFKHRSGAIVTGAEARAAAARYINNEIEKLK